MPTESPSPPDLQHELDAARQTIAHLERRQRVTELLSDEQTIDLEAARLLTELAVAGMDEPDVEAAITDLKRHRPYLFAAPRSRLDESSESLAMSPHVDPPDEAVTAAAIATQTGNRRDLMRYVRLRRGVR